MANPQLLAYIREHASQFPKEALVQSLAAAGWTAADISEAFKEIEQPPVPAPAPTPAPTPTPAPAPAQAMPPPVQTPPTSTAPVTPIQIKPVTLNPQPQAQPAPAETDFLAQMEKRRQEAAAKQPQNPYQNITVGQTPAYQQFRPDPSAPTEKGIIGALIKMKVAKDAAQANMIMIGIVAVCIALSAWFLWPSSPAAPAGPATLPMTPPGTTQ
jgi:hypothetical protein